MSSTTALGSLTTQSRVAQILRERILSGELPVGARLRQMDLSEELGVSTTPTREALRTLAAEGLLQIDSHRGAVVRALSPAEQLELYQLQLLLERDNLSYAVARMTPQALDRAAAAQSEMRTTRSAVHWALLNRDFHLALAEPAGRPRVLQLLTDLLNVTAVQVRGDIEHWAGRREEALAEHDNLLAAIRLGALDVAQRILDGHTRAPMRNLESRLGA
ncbi:GntR family transcriptional regulator [Kineosporia babensis]|uniref:GntR family transcriptional regulator n=1 Tax=Kineosporia babensis TaxID=499548 RepID=A0A9X1SVR7_9ACTN|nr:GntR family transcriptional regulator [Kineosporia babensis]